MEIFRAKCLSVISDNNWDDENSGTVIYMPPERFKKKYNPNAKSDIWSLGATIYEIVTGDVPFGDKGGENQSEGQSIPEIKVKILMFLLRLITFIEKIIMVNLIIFLIPQMKIIHKI